MNHPFMTDEQDALGAKQASMTGSISQIPRFYEAGPSSPEKIKFISKSARGVRHVSDMATQPGGTPLQKAKREESHAIPLYARYVSC